MKKLLAGIMAIVFFSGTGIFGFSTSAEIGSNSPVPFSTDTAGKAEQKEFKEYKPVVKATLAEGYYDYYYYYDDYCSNYVELTWNNVDHALLYYVYRKGPDDAAYKKIASTCFNSYYDGLNKSGEYRYKVQAVSYNYDDVIVKSEQSTAAVIKISEPKAVENKDYADSGVSYAGTEDTTAGAAYDEEVVVEESVDSGAGETVEEEKAVNSNEEYTSYDENGFRSTANYPLSTFSSDVDTASYSNLRRLINDDCQISSDAVRIEEMLNYFHYDYKQPTGDKPFSVTTELSDCPWNKDAKLLLVGVQGKDVTDDKLPASNLVYLLDVSGSMDSEDKLDLVKKSIKMLTKTMTSKDRLSIITYSGSERVVLEGAKGTQTKTVSAVLNCLEAGGCTNGEAGIQKAYEIAEKYYIKGGDNRIILATDGDLNVGISDEDELKKLIEEKRKSGVNFSVLGFGTGNIKDDNMQALADNGNGSYHYIDTAIEAQKVLVEQKKSTLYTIAKDVKFQVEFNPKYVKGYRLIGYETRKLNTEDFTDDAKDAGDIGVGHTVTALYEIIPADSKMNISSTDLKYQTKAKTTTSSEWMTVNIRYKKPDGTKSMLITKTVSGDAYTASASENLNFAAAVAELGMILQDSEYKGNSSLAEVKKILAKCSTSEDKYKQELNKLIELLDKNYDYN